MGNFLLDVGHIHTNDPKKRLSDQTRNSTSVGAGFTIIAACHPDVTKPALTKCKNSWTNDIRQMT